MVIKQKKLADYLELINNSGNIKLGLDRWRHLVDLLPAKTKPLVITVAGTNGKGSCIELLEQALFAANVSYAAYTSPHIYDFKERLKINQAMLTDACWLSAFNWLDAISDVELSPFEFYTMAALYLAYANDIQVLILEVGMGGRFDAVNVIDPDYAVITEIDYDHMDRLGNSLSEIAYQKAGIMRANRPVIYAGLNAKADIIKYAKELGANLLLPKRDILQNQPIALAASSGIAALALADLLPFALDMQAAIANFQLAGRFERLPYLAGEIIFDVAHNPAAMTNLVNNLRAAGINKVGLWISLAKTKDIVGCIASLRDVTEFACVSKHSNILAYDCAYVRDELQGIGVSVIRSDVDYAESQAVLQNLQQLGCGVVLVVGSFQHVGMVKQKLGLI